VRKALYLILIAGAAFGQTPQPNDTVLAWNPSSYVPAGSGWPSLPYATWTNSTAWYAFPASLNPLSALDASPVRSNGVYAGSGCGTFDGSAVWCRFGNVWATQNPHVKAKFKITGGAGTSRWIAERRSAAATSQWEWQLTINTSNLLAFSPYGQGEGIYSASSDSTLSLNTWYDAEAYYDRANSKTVLKYRVNGSDEWIVSERTSVPALTFSGATQSAVGAAGWALGAYPNPSLFFIGQIAEVEVCDYVTGSSLGHYPLSSRWGNQIHDVSGNGNHGTLTTGAGGQATFWGGTQDEVHWNLTKGHAAWTDGTNTTRVPYLANMSGPAATNVVGSTLIEQRPASFVHNKAETTIDGFSYSNLITNALWTVTTNAAGFITEARQP